MSPCYMSTLMNLLDSINRDFLIETPLLGALALITSIAWSFDYFGLISRHGLHLHVDLSVVHKRSMHYWSRLVLFLFALICWSALIFASLSPYRYAPRGKISESKLDLFFVFDVSLSMLADDYFPNRLQAAKGKLMDIVERLEGTSMGLILFSEDIETVVPLSTDTNFLVHKIQNIQVGPLGAGTNIGDALMLALSRLSISDLQKEKKNKKKVIILITDGVAQIGLTHPMAAAKQLSKNGIVLYAIGMGVSATARLPNNQLIPGGSADMGILHKMANMTNGKAYTGYSNDELLKALESIGAQENILYDPTSAANLVKDYFFASYFVFILIGLMIVEMIKKFIWKEIL